MGQVHIVTWLQVGDFGDAVKTWNIEALRNQVAHFAGMTELAAMVWKKCAWGSESAFEKSSLGLNQGI